MAISMKLHQHDDQAMLVGPRPPWFAKLPWDGPPSTMVSFGDVYILTTQTGGWDQAHQSAVIDPMIRCSLHLQRPPFNELSSRARVLFAVVPSNTSDCSLFSETQLESGLHMVISCLSHIKPVIFQIWDILWLYTAHFCTCGPQETCCGRDLSAIPGAWSIGGMTPVE